MGLIEINWRPDRRQLRQFGLIFLAFAALAGTFLWLRHGASTAAAIVWGAGALAGLLGLAWPSALRPLYALLMAVSLPIGMAVSTVLLALIYYVVLTPIGLLARAFGYDAMRRRFDRSARSYWIRRSTSPGVRRYFKQY